jgi:hypothetical protein
MSQCTRLLPSLGLIWEARNGEKSAGPISGVKPYLFWGYIKKTRKSTRVREMAKPARGKHEMAKEVKWQNATAGRAGRDSGPFRVPWRAEQKAEFRKPFLPRGGEPGRAVGC